MQCPNCTCNQMTRLYKYFRCCFFLQFPKNVPPQPTSDEDDSDVKEEYSSDSSLTDDNREGRGKGNKGGPFKKSRSTVPDPPAAAGSEVCVTAYTPYHGRPQDFFQGWAIRGSEGRKSPNRVQRQLPGWGSGAKPPETDNIFSKWCINTSSTEVLDNICSIKHVSTLPGRDKCPLAHARGRPCSI